METCSPGERRPTVPKRSRARRRRKPGCKRQKRERSRGGSHCCRRPQRYSWLQWISLVQHNNRHKQPVMVIYSDEGLHPQCVLKTQHIHWDIKTKSANAECACDRDDDVRINPHAESCVIEAITKNRKCPWKVPVLMNTPKKMTKYNCLSFPFFKIV